MRWRRPICSTLVGHIKFDGSPHKNVCKTPIFGGQWVKGEKWPYDLKIVDNTVNQLFAPAAEDRADRLVTVKARTRRTCDGQGNPAESARRVEVLRRRPRPA